MRTKSLTTSSGRKNLGPLLLALVACGTSQSVTPKPAASPPAWFERPPTRPDTLFFVGDADDAPDPDRARQLAVNRALAQLSVFCGARLISNERSEQLEVDGRGEQRVETTLEVAGEPVQVRETRLAEVRVEPAAEGRYRAYVMLAWPKSAYLALRKHERDQTARALALFRAAERAEGEGRLDDALARLDEAEPALGPDVTPVEDTAITSAGALRQAILQLRAALRARRETRRRTALLVVNCRAFERPAKCPEGLVGHLESALGEAGFQVVPERPPSAAVDALFAGEAPNAPARSAAGLWAVTSVALTGVERDVHRFVYTRFSGRIVLFDPAANRIAWSHTLTPTKVGAVDKNTVVRLGWQRASAMLLSALQPALATWR